MKVKVRKYPRWNIIPDWLKPKQVKVKIDPWDTWSFDYTLAEIVLPGLIQLKEAKHGAPFVDDEDVPQYLTGGKDWQGCDKFHFERWDYIMDRMIISFDDIVTDEKEWEYYEKGDMEGAKRYNEEMQFGLELFGKYFRSLWD